MQTLIIPLSLAILAIFLFLIYIKQSLSYKRVLKLKLILASGLIFIFILAFFFQEEINKIESLKNVFIYIYLACYLLLGILFYIAFSKSLQFKKLNDDFISFISQERLYVLLDKKNKILDISDSFLEKLSKTKKEVFKHDFFTLFDSVFTIEYINDEKLDNKDLEKQFKSYNEVNFKNAKNIHLELKVYDDKNNAMVLNFTDKMCFQNNEYQGHMLIGAVKTDDEVMNVEQELSDRNDELDIIKERFTAELDLSNEGIFFLNLEEKYYWMNDTLKDLLKLPGNSISCDDFYKLMYPEDVAYYTKTLSELTPKNPEYEISYRFKTGTSYTYLRERGRKIFTESTNEISGYVNEIETNHYERSNIVELDNCKSDKEMLVKLDELFNENVTFQLAKFRLTNLPDINKSFGRDMGNMVLAEYMKAIWKNFVDDKMIYRASGLEFYFILIDPRKMSILKRGLETQSVLNPNMKYGSQNVKLNVNMGIATSSKCYNSKALIEGANKALEFSTLDNVKTDYMYYDDVA